MLRAEFSLPSITAEEATPERKAPIRVKFEIPYFTVSGIQVCLSISSSLFLKPNPNIRSWVHNGFSVGVACTGSMPISKVHIKCCFTASILMHSDYWPYTLLVYFTIRTFSFWWGLKINSFTHPKSFISFWHAFIFLSSKMDKVS